MKRKSLKDIARELGVSASLVSLVLNNRGDEVGISPATQERVRRLAKSLNYRPNQLARNLRLQKTQTIGVIVPNLADAFYARIVHRIQQLLGEHGFSVLVCSSEEDQQKEAREINLLRDRQVDGFIIAPTEKNSDLILKMRKAKIPFVLIDRYFPRINTNRVSFQNFEGALLAVQHLIARGYRRIAQLTISPHLFAIKERDRGYRTALKEAGLRFNKNLSCEIQPDSILHDVKQALDDFLALPNPPDAIFAHNNVIAGAVLDVAAEQGLRIPDDLALISFGDHALFKVTNPPVTCVDQPMEMIGEKSVEILLQEIEREGRPLNDQQIIFPTKLIARQST